MDEETETSLDNLVKDIQLTILVPRCSALGPNDVQKQEMSAYIYAITLINKHFKTNYLDYEILSMKITDENRRVIEGLVSKLPLKKE